MARRKGRPAKAGARRRQTTRTGRQAPPDYGTPELRALRSILTPGRIDLPTDSLAALFSRGFISQESYNTGRVFAALTRIVRSGWGLSDGGVQRLWRMVALGQILEPSPVAVITNGHDHGGAYADYARQRLEEMRRELQRRGEDERILVTVVHICVDGGWPAWCRRILTRLPELPGDWRSLGDLKEGLERLVELRSGRRREAPPARAEAAE
jgi:hypothetical protein